MVTEPNKNWQPQLLRGEQLRSWAHSTAEVTTTTKLFTARDKLTAADVASSLHSGAQQAMDAGPNEGDRACHEGCPGCCHSLISVTPPEACNIAEYLREQMSAEEVDAIRQHATENAEKSQEMDNTEYAKSMLWCPLLDSHLKCSVYEVRPTCCRAWNSLSLSACHECYFSNHVEKTIPLDDHAYNVGQGVRTGFSAAIDGAGLDGKHYELNSALIKALDTPDAAERWARGEEVFENCHQA